MRDGGNLNSRQIGFFRRQIAGIFAESGERLGYLGRHQTFDHDFGRSRNFQRHGFATHHFQRRADDSAGDAVLVLSAVGNWRGGHCHQRRRRSDDDRHRQGFLALSGLGPVMCHGVVKNRAAGDDPVPRPEKSIVGADVDHAGFRILGDHRGTGAHHTAKTGLFDRRGNLVQSQLREFFSSVYFFVNRSIGDQHRRHRLDQAGVPALEGFLHGLTAHTPGEKLARRAIDAGGDPHARSPPVRPAHIVEKQHRALFLRQATRLHAVERHQFGLLVDRLSEFVQPFAPPRFSEKVA